MALATKYLSLLVLTLGLGHTFGSPDDEPLTDQRQGHLKDLPMDIRRNLERGLVEENEPDKSRTQWEKKILGIHNNYQDTPLVEGCIEDANNINSITCYGINVTEIPQNLSRTIESISFISTGIEIIPDDIFRNYTKLSLIHFNQNFLKEISSGAFRGLSNLTNLLLINNGLLDISFENETFEGLSSLELFMLWTDELTKLPKYLLAGATNLEYLWVEYTLIDQAGLELISPLDKLIHLDLSANKFSSLEPSIFYQMANLEFLILDYNQIMIIKSGALEGLDKLEHFDATDMKIGLTVQDDAFNRNLRFLDLNNNQPMNISTLALVNAPALEEISLSLCDLTYLDGAPFMYNPHLKKLDISWNPFVCDCHASWMAEAIVESKPWAQDWGTNGITRSPECNSPLWMSGMDISDLYPQDLTCDKPYIDAITPTFIRHDWNTNIIFKARMTKGYPQAKWVLPDRSVIKGRRQPLVGWVKDTVVDSDHSVITQCEVYKGFNITGLFNVTLVASNVAGESSLTFWVFAEPRPSSAIGGPPVPTVSILLLLMLVVHYVK